MRIAHGHSFVLSDLSDSLTVAHFLWATWAICSRSLICRERSDQIAHSRSFDLNKFPALVSCNCVAFFCLACILHLCFLHLCKLYAPCTSAHVLGLSVVAPVLSICCTCVACLLHLFCLSVTTVLPAPVLTAPGLPVCCTCVACVLQLCCLCVAPFLPVCCTCVACTSAHYNFVACSCRCCLHLCCLYVEPVLSAPF